MKTKIALFAGQEIRKIWDADKELWYFSVVDIVRVLTNSADPRNYWKVLKYRIKEKGSEMVTKCHQLKMQASDGKSYLTDAADTETISQPVPPLKIRGGRGSYEQATL